MEINKENFEHEFERLKQATEAILFSSDQPVSHKRLREILEIEDKMLMNDILDALKTDYNQSHRSFQIFEIANGYQIMTRPEFSGYVEKLYGTNKKYRLTRSALETLAIIAYKQPITKPLLDKIRGVDSGYILNKLLEYDLVKVLGRSEKPGRPLVIGTTENFLQFFGLKKLSDMPKLEELGELDEYLEEEGEAGQEELPFTPDFGDNETVESVEESDTESPEVKSSPVKMEIEEDPENHEEEDSLETDQIKEEEVPLILGQKKKNIDSEHITEDKTTELKDEVKENEDIEDAETSSG